MVTATLYDWTNIRGLNVKWASIQKPIRERTFARMDIGLSHDTVSYFDSRRLTNIVRAVVERVFLTARFENVPLPQKGIYKNISWFAHAVSKEVGVLCPRSRADFVASYIGTSKHKNYLRALDTFTTRPVVTFVDSVIKAFVKVEKTNTTLKANPAPRLISPRSPRFNIELGRYLKFVEHRVYKAVGKVCGGTVICKGLNALQRGRLAYSKWSKFKKPVAVGIDASRFDQHVSVEALRFEHSLYTQIYPGDTLLNQLLSWQCVTHAVAYAADGRLKFTREGGRCSGDMNTAMGNCFISCALVYQYLSEKGIAFDFMNDGDDTVIFIEGDDVGCIEDLPTWFLQYGFTMKVEEPVSVLEELEFCQCHPVLGPDGYTMVRNPRKVFENDLVSNKVNSLNEAYGHLSAIRGCGLALNSGIPMFQEFYKALPSVQRAHTLPEYGFTSLVSGMCREARPISDATRLSFWKAFGVFPQDQTVFEDWCRRCIKSEVQSIKEINLQSNLASVAFRYKNG